jgi:hypothetical protein
MDDDDENFATHKHRANSCEFFLTVELVTRFTCQQLRTNFLFTGSHALFYVTTSFIEQQHY